MAGSHAHPLVGRNSVGVLGAGETLAVRVEIVAIDDDAHLACPAKSAERLNRTLAT